MDRSKKTKNEKVLPKILPGTIHAQFVRCGKSNCRCAKGELHGAYFYLFVRVNGKLTKKYLKAAEVEAVRKMCETRQMIQKHYLNEAQKIRLLYRQLRDLMRDVQSGF